MNISIDSDKLRLWRKERCWSQETAAEKAGLSIRTIQRIESSGVASHDSTQALADLFEVDVKEFIILEEGLNGGDASDSQKFKGVAGLRLSFVIHAAGFVIGVVTLLLIDWIDYPSLWWSTPIITFWVIGLFAHGVTLILVEYVERMSGKMRDLGSPS